MALSLEAESAFNNAIEAAYAMQEAAVQFGNRSEEVEFASKVYQYWMQEYYALKDNSDWWSDRCLMEPYHPGCKLYDV